MYKKILAPVDGSPTSNRGLREAIRIALDQKAKLRLMHVIDEHIAHQIEAISSSRRLLASVERHGKHILKDARALAARHRIDAESILCKTDGGLVGDTIVAEAARWRADLIVMGTHGRRGVGYLFLGSDACAVVRGASTRLNARSGRFTGVDRKVVRRYQRLTDSLGVATGWPSTLPRSVRGELADSGQHLAQGEFAAERLRNFNLRRSY